MRITAGPGKLDHLFDAILDGQAVLIVLITHFGT